MTRRNALKSATLGLSTLALGRAVAATDAATDAASTAATTKHSACYWCYNGIELDEFCERGKDVGLKSVELTSVKQWPTLKKHGLTCAMGTLDGFSIENGWNEPENWDHLRGIYTKALPEAADHGIPSMIVMSGNRRGMSDYDGMINCAKGLEPIVKLAEETGVTLQMELLNSKVNHPDYMCDHTQWGAALAEMIGSDHFKLLYDIYHMQIMEGDVIATIRKYHPYIGHYHTGGVPGRNEINDSQELNYPAIIRAIHETGFEGYVAQEFIPTYDDKIRALEEGLRICEV